MISEVNYYGRQLLHRGLSELEVCKSHAVVHMLAALAGGEVWPKVCETIQLDLVGRGREDSDLHF